jgi:putative endonuclease
MMNRQDSGQAAERLARAHLEQQGMQLVAQNWHCRRGELDLVMLDGSSLVFVEVRYRQHKGWGGALESIDARKRAKLILAAEQFLHSDARWRNYACRFDVVALASGADGKPCTLNWLKNAFDC